MRRKQVLSLFMLVMGVALLATAMVVGGASSATKKAGSAEALKGGTLKLNENSEDFDYVDPGLAYRTDDWSMLYTVNLMLVNFPEKSGAAGSQHPLRIAGWAGRRQRHLEIAVMALQSPDVPVFDKPCRAARTLQPMAAGAA